MTKLENILSEKLTASNGACQFVGFTYAAKSSGEIARHVLRVGVNYERVLRSSLLALKLRASTFTGLEIQACAELAQSFETSLAAMAEGKENPNYTKKGLYTSLGNGLKMFHDGTLEISGLSHSKVVLREGVFPHVNSRPLTIAKDKLRKQLLVGQWRTFALDAAQITVRIQGETLELN